jgi:hypothetical protein
MLRNTLRDNPRASEADIRDKCLAVCLHDRNLQIALFTYWFENSFGDLTVVEQGDNSVAVLRTQAPRAERAQTQVTRGAKVNDLKQRLKACLMDHELSDGTALRDATFGQCARESGWLLAVSKQGRANEIVGKKLTEHDLVNLQRRAASKARAA